MPISGFSGFSGSARHPAVIQSLILYKFIFKTEEYINQIINYLLPSVIELEEVKEFTKIDPVLQRVINENNWSNAEITGAFKQRMDEFTVSNGMILKRLTMVIPQRLRKRCLDSVHK